MLRNLCEQDQNVHNSRVPMSYDGTMAMTHASRRNTERTENVLNRRSYPLSSPVANVVRCSINPRSGVRSSVESNFLVGRRNFSRGKVTSEVYFFLRQSRNRRCRLKGSYDY